MEIKEISIPIMETHEVTVYLSEPQAREFIVFQQYYPMIRSMLDAKVFEQKNAAVTLHFDKNGKLGNITRTDVLYDRRFDLK